MPLPYPEAWWSPRTVSRVFEAVNSVSNEFLLGLGWGSEAVGCAEHSLPVCWSNTKKGEKLFQPQGNVSSRINAVWADCDKLNNANAYSSSREQQGVSVASFMASIQTGSEMDAFMTASLWGDPCSSWEPDSLILGFFPGVSEGDCMNLAGSLLCVIWGRSRCIISPIEIPAASSLAFQSHVFLLLS